MVNFSKTIIPKSDQLNADDLVRGALTIKITEVKAGSNDQPCIIKFEGDQGRPYKPNKSMRKLIISQWGDEGDNWIGKFLTLWRDPTVKWAGEEVGGIVISGMSDIQEDFKMALVVTRGKKKAFPVKKLVQKQLKADPAPPPAQKQGGNPIADADYQSWTDKMDAVDAIDALKIIGGQIKDVSENYDQASIDKLQAYYADRYNAIKANAPQMGE